jgi:hypothetical protein
VGGTALAPHPMAHDLHHAMIEDEQAKGPHEFLFDCILKLSATIARRAAGRRPFRARLDRDRLFAGEVWAPLRSECRDRLLMVL